MHKALHERMKHCNPILHNYITICILSLYPALIIVAIPGIRIRPTEPPDSANGETGDEFVFPVSPREGNNMLIINLFEGC